MRSPLVEAGPEAASDAVLLLHGNHGSAADRENLLPAIAKLGRVVACDLPGFGGADNPKHLDYTAGTYATFIGAAVEDLRSERVRPARLRASGGMIRPVRFEKWQALGNDYLIVEAPELPWKLTPERVRRLCEPHFGAGSDGVLELSPAADDGHVAELRIFNPDGSEAELSGNGSRQAALYLRNAGWTDADRFTIATRAGDVTPTVTGPNTVEMAIGRASVASPDYPSGPSDGTGTLTAAGREWRFQHVNVGNPQCVIEVGDEVEALDLAAIGPAIERHELFPNRTNVSFIRIDRSMVRARIFERGAGETLSSGTGASGAAVAAHLHGAPSPIAVALDGGELTVELSEDLDVTLIGTAEPVYAGELSPKLVRALANG